MEERHPLVRRDATAPPAPPGAGTTDLGPVLRLLTLAVGTAVFAALVQYWLVGDPHAPRLLAGELLLVGLVLWLNRRGAAMWAGRILAVSLPLLATALILTARTGLGDPSVLIYPAAMIVAGLLLNRRSLVVLTVVVIACVAVVTFGEAGNPGGLRLADATNYFIDATLILAVTALGIGVVAGHLHRAVEGLQRGEAALVRANVALADQAERLRSSEARYRDLIDLAADAILVEDDVFRITHVNDRACQLTGRGREELLGWTIEVLFAPGSREAGRQQSLAEGKTVVEERALLRKDGTILPVEMSSKRMPDGSRQAIIRDVSERKGAERERAALESRLHQSQKMAAIGRLAGGVAHDFNNLLTAITSSLTMALREVPETTRAHRWLKEVDAAAWRAAALTRQLLSFGQRQAVKPRVLDLREVVREIQPVLAQLVGDTIALDIHLPATPCPVSVDQVQVERAVLNLAANARDAMPGGGTLSIVMVPDPPRVTLSVSDTGTGLGPGVREHLFEPFFTTKSSEQGTGLGLAIVHAAVEQNKGFIDVASEPGRGATFRMSFPLVAREAAAAADSSGGTGPGEAGEPH
jgi:PAS domain S-box-containing protein